MEPATMMGAGALLSGIGSIGSLFGGSSKSALRAQENIAGQNLKMQEAFAKEGIRWRVDDAKKAGIHPLYALGASIPSYSPSTYIPGDSGPKRDYGSALRGLGQASQDLGRAIDAGRTSHERTDARLQELALTRGELENDLLRSQIARLNQPTIPTPSLSRQFMPGQSDIEKNALVVHKPLEVTRSHPTNPSQEPHPIIDTGFVRTNTGLAPVPSKDVKERIEDQFVPEAMWALRNHLVPNLGSMDNAPPSSMLPQGAYSWRWEHSRQEWQPVYRRPRSKPSYESFWPRGGDERTWSGRPYLGRSRVGSYW